MQATLDAYFAPVHAGGDGASGDGASDDGGYLWEPGHQTLTCSVYLYTCARTGEYVYVGQTIQEPRARDRQHRTSWQTVFDRSYVEDGQYVFTVIEPPRVFEADVACEDHDRALHAEAQAWLDARETHNIDEYQTYDPTGAGPGLNQTRGGQPGALVACVQAARRESHRRWRELYAPGFEAWQRANQTSLLHVKRADTVPAPEAEDGVLPLGQLVNRIRTGHTPVPAQWRAWLDERGFAWDYQAAMWERVYIPGFEAWMEANQISLLHVKRADTVPAPEAEDGVLPLGTLVNHIRTGHTPVPAQWRAWLDERGFAWDYQAAMWERVYIPGFQVWQEANQTSLLHVKYADTVPAPEARDGILKLGTLVNSIRTGATAVPAAWRAWLDERGFRMGLPGGDVGARLHPGIPGVAGGEPDLALARQAGGHGPRAGGSGRRPADRHARRQHPHRRHGRARRVARVARRARLCVGLPGGDPSTSRDSRCGRKRTRPRSCTCPSPRRSGARGSTSAAYPPRGARGSTSAASCGTPGDATHVQRRLQRLKEQLPTTAPALAQDAEVTAALSALYGTGAFGLASESLVELEARYLGDLARL